MWGVVPPERSCEMYWTHYFLDWYSLTIPELLEASIWGRNFWKSVKTEKDLMAKEVRCVWTLIRTPQSVNDFGCVLIETPFSRIFSINNRRLTHWMCLRLLVIKKPKSTLIELIHACQNELRWQKEKWICLLDISDHTMKNYHQLHQKRSGFSI